MNSPLSSKSVPCKANLFNKLWLQLWSILLLPAGLLGLVKQSTDLQLRFLSFRVREDDIFIATYPRSGTTWLQMILYQLTTDGSMDFTHISQKSPWLERMFQAPRNALHTMPSPRLLKTHLNYGSVPKGPSRYIYVARDGRDVAASIHNFRNLQLAFPKSFNKFISGKVSGGSWFQHVKDWWANEDGLNLLFLTYEDIRADPEANIRRIAAFIGVTLDDARLTRTLERSSLAFMREHENKFDFLHMLAGEQGLLGGRFIHEGKTGGAPDMIDKEMNSTYLAMFQDCFGDEEVPFRPK